MASISYNFKAETVIAEGRTSLANIVDIKLWLKNQQIPKLNDESIVLFLLSCENQVEPTKKTILAHFKCKGDSPEIFDQRDICRHDLKLALNTVNVSSIPVRTDDNDVIHFFKINDTNHLNFNLVPIMKISYMILDISQKSNPPNGLIAIIDMKGLGLMHLTRLKLDAMKKYFEFLQEGLPIKLKVIHILNAVWFFDKIMNIVRVFMKNELIEMLKIHPPGMDMLEFHEKYIPAKCLPADYGGNLPPFRNLNESSLEQFTELREFFEIEENHRKSA